MSHSLQRAFVSDIDKKLAALDQTAAVQHNPQHKAEVKKAKRIEQMRDQANASQKPGQIWEDF